MEGMNFHSACFCGTMQLMKKQATLQPQKKRGPLPTGKGTPVQVRLQPVELATIDNWRRKQEDLPSRPESIRRLVELGLKKS
jgi:hypothetical protein